MFPRPHSLPRIVLLALCLLCAPAALAQEETPYPIWWSPELKLESIDRIDERMKRRFWSNDFEGIPVVRDTFPEDEQVFVDSCASYFELRTKGYYARINNNMLALMFHSSICHALEMLASAKPSHTSYVNRFKFGENAIAYLPAMVSSAGSNDFACRQFVANERRIPWSKFEVFEFEDINFVHDYEMKVTTTGERLRLQILAHADFNNDGLEDLLLRVNTGAVGGTWGSTDIISITRDSPNGVFWMLDAEKSLDPSYTCQETYDYPDALRESN